MKAIMNMHISARNPNRKNAHKGGSGPLISTEYSYTLETGQPHYVLDIPKSTSMQSKSTSDTSQNINNMETSQKSTKTNCRTLTSLLEDSLVRLSLLQESERGLKTLEELCSLILRGYSNGNTFRTILATIDELGYEFQWQVLNSKNFGVPQNRERVFIVGHLRGTPRPQVFPITDSNPKTPEQLVGGSQGNRVYATSGTSVTLASQAGGQGAKTGLYAKTVRSGGRNSPHGSKQNWDSYEFDGQIRRLTPLECERLQGFPDNFTAIGADGKPISDSQRYKVLGNAVTVNVIKAIIERILI